MKKFILLLSLILVASCAVKTPYDTFRKENKKDIDFSMGLSNFLARNLIMDKEARVVTKDLGIQKYRLLVANSSSEILEKKFDTFLNKNNFEELIRVSGNGQKVKVYTYQINQSVKEVIIKLYNGKDLVLLSAKGKNILTSNIDGLVTMASAEN